MTFLNTDKMKLSVLVVAFLLLVSAFTFLPAVGAFSPTTVAKDGPAPATVTGATVTMDSPAIAGLGLAVTRTITVTNPTGNPAITSITISVPTAAVKTGTAPSGAFPTDSGVPAAGTVQTFGSGPWAVVYPASGSGILVPGGAAIKLQLTFTTESALSTTGGGVADAYSFTVSAQDNSGSSSTTNLPSITVYETDVAPAGLTVTAPTGTITAGSNFVVQVSASDSGIGLTATASDKTTTISPASFTTGSGSTSLTVNDTTSGTLTLTVGSGKFDTTDSSGGNIATSIPITISPGALSEVTALITYGATQYKTGQMINVTSYAAIAGTAITVTLADKFGNGVQASGSGTAITLTAVAINSQCSGGVSLSTCYGFSTGGVSGAYPYTPASPVTTQTLSVTITSGSSVTLSSNYFFGVDYGAESYITATPTSGGLAASNSATIRTLSLNSATPTVTPTHSNPLAGKTTTLVATVSGTQQANVPFNFANTTDYGPKASYSGSFSNGKMSVNVTSSIVTVSSVLTEEANATFTPSTKAGATITLWAKYPTPQASGTFSYGTAGSSGAIATQAGAASSLTLKTYFDSAATNPSSDTNSSGGLYVVAYASDAYGNPASVPVVTQVNFATTGALSVSFADIPASGQSTIASPVLAVPTSGESSYTVTASAVVSSTQVTGSTTITVVSVTPSLSLTGPQTIGVDTFSGVANVSAGVSTNGAPGYIKLIEYSLNGATNVTVTTGGSTSQSLSYAFSVLLTKSANSISVYAEDNAGDYAVQTITVPPVGTAMTFTAPSGATPAQYQFPNGGPQAVNATFTNNGVNQITIIVIANIFTSGGIPLTPSPTATATVAAGATASTFELLNGLPHGTYTVQITVYNSAYVTLSPTYTVTVTV